MNDEATAIAPKDRPSNEFWERVTSTDSKSPANAKKLWSDDAMIDAWFLGREAAEKDRQAMNKKQIIESLGRTTAIARKILDTLKSKSIGVWQVYLRLESMFDYELLIVVDEAPFISKEFDSVYNLVGDIEEGEHSETYRPAIHFMPVPKGKQKLIDQQALEGDGYFFRLKDIAPAKRTRTAQ